MFIRNFRLILDQNGSQKLTCGPPWDHLFGDIFRTSILGCILTAFWLPFGPLWLPFGSLSLPFGSFWLPFGSFWLHFGPFWLHFSIFSRHFPVSAPILVPFSIFALRFYIFPLKRYKFSFKIQFSTPRLAEHLQKNVGTFTEGALPLLTDPSHLARSGNLP